MQDENGDLKFENKEIAAIFLNDWKSTMTSSPGDSDAQLLQHFQPVISEEENAELIRIPTTEEIGP